jgi:hypothetical protein
LDERYDGKNVLLAGMITSVRTINTKKGEPMAFVQLEDMAGQVEVVVFPRTYAEVKEMLIPEAVVLVKGKAQTRENQTSLLADSFQNYVDRIISVGPEPQWQRPLLDAVPTVNGARSSNSDEEETSMETGSPGAMDGSGFFGDDDDDLLPADENPFRNEPPAWTVAQTQPKAAPARRIEEAAPDNPYLHESRSLRDEDTDVTPLPVGLSQDALDLVAPAMDKAASVAAHAATEEAAPDNPYLHESRSLREAEQDVTPMPQHLRDDPAFRPEAPSPPPVAAAPTQAEGPVQEAASRPSDTQSNGHTRGRANGHTNGRGNGRSTPAAKSARTLEIVFRPSGDLDRDKYRLKEIVDAVRDPRGRDQFVVVIKSGRKQTTLAFPNDPCSISDRLRQQLNKFFRVEVSVADESAQG